MSYIKDSNKGFIYIGLDGKEIFSSKSISILTVEGKLVKHGTTKKIHELYHEMMTKGRMTSCADSDNWDLSDPNWGLNKLIGNIPPEF